MRIVQQALKIPSLFLPAPSVPPGWPLSSRPPIRRHVILDEPALPLFRHPRGLSVPQTRGLGGV